jgi:copper chaperone CopZ
MKKPVYLALFLLSTCISNAQFTKAELRVDGLTCSLCSKATEKQLSTLKFIDSICMNLDQATFILYFKKGRQPNFDSIKQKVQDAGFSVGMLEVTYKFTDFPMDTSECFTLQNNVFRFLNMKPQTFNGEVTFRIIEQGFLPRSKYRRYIPQMTAHPSNQYLHVYYAVF